MMCGCEARPAGGTTEKALAGGGCGHEFNFDTLEPIAFGRPGAPAHERQTRFVRPSGGRPAATAQARNRQHEEVLELPPGIKACPACGILLEKVSGDSSMMCGCEARAAGGTTEKAIAGGGCGHEFDFDTLAPIAYGRPGNPAHPRQRRFYHDNQYSGPRVTCVHGVPEDWDSALCRNAQGDGAGGFANHVARCRCAMS